jgi:hypothetical protein
MSITIEVKAMKTLLYGIFSCQCPVTPETEKGFVAEYFRFSQQVTAPIDSFLAVADANPDKTPLHLFVEFCAFAQADPTSFHITEKDLLRYFASRYHFDRIAMAVNPLKVFNPAAHVVGHLLLPVTITEGSGDRMTVEFAFRNRRISFENVFRPRDIAVKADACYGFHLGSIVAELDRESEDMVEKHLSSNRDFVGLTKQVHLVDYADYQSFGNYFEHTKQRHQIMAR